MIKIIKEIITKLDNKKTYSCIFLFGDESNIKATSIIKNETINISLPSQLGCYCNCNYCRSNSKNIRNLDFIELKYMLNTILESAKNVTNIKFINIHMSGDGEPFLNWKNIELFAEDCFKNKYNEFHLYTIGLSYLDIMDRTIKLGVSHKSFFVHLTLTDIDDQKRNQYFQYKNLPYLIVRRIIDYANRFKHYTKKCMYIDYYVNGNESKSDLEVFKKRFKDCSIQLKCILPKTQDEINNLYKLGDDMINYLGNDIKIFNFDKDELILKSCLYDNDMK